MAPILTDLFMQMVRIDSESGNETQMMAFLEGFFKEKLQAEVELDGYGNLIARIPALNSDKREPILFSCHADTVKPGQGIDPYIDDEGMIRSRGETILGADDKAGIAEVLAALLGADKRPPAEFVITREEEIGLVGAKHLDTSRLKARHGFLVDSDVLDTIIIGGPSHCLIDVQITGKSAHAGMEPEKGISAIVAASRAIAEMPLGRLDHESTANVGIMQGGAIRNGIPEEVSIKAECRSLNHDKCVAQAELMQRLFVEAAESMGARAEVKLDYGYKASSIPEDAYSVQLSMEAIRSIGLEPKTQIITGGTDASILNEKGIITAVLGTGVRDEHSKNEHVAVADMENAVRLLVYILEKSA